MIVNVWDKRDTLWLPEPIAQRVKNQEAARFHTCVLSIADYSHAYDDNPEGALVDTHWLHSSITWIGHVNKFLQTKTEYDIDDINLLYQSVMHMVGRTASMLTIKYKWLQTAVKILRTYMSKLVGHLTLPLDVYWQLYHEVVDDATDLDFNGAPATMYRLIVAELCKMAKSLFPASSAVTVWERLIKTMRQVHSPECLGAAVTLLIFFPHQGVATDTDCPWNTWAQQAIDLWKPMANNLFWNSVWMCFLARLAKHDVKGVIDWGPIIPYVCTRSTWLFSVRVGNAAAPFLHNIAPRFPYDSLRHFAIKQGSSALSHLTKILIYTLRTGSSQSRDDRLTSLQALQKMAALFEHFFHASNAGPWSDQFADFLDSLSWYLMRRRLVAENHPEWDGDPSLKLDPTKLQPVMNIILQLALPALHHKSSRLRNASHEVISNAAFVCPDAVLPTIVMRFHEAMEASDSVHQISGSIRALTSCVRPLLLRGLILNDEETQKLEQDSSLSPHELACSEISRAMMMLLPGLDANDQAKTERTIAFYLAVFSNCVSITGLDLPRKEDETVMQFPFYIADFVIQLLDNLFAVIEALKGRGGGDVDVGSAEEAGPGRSWFGKYHRTEYMVQELFYKAPHSVVPDMVRKVANFVLGLSTVGSVMDCSSFIMSCAEVSPKLTIDLILKPTLRVIEEDTDVLKGQSNVSQAGAGYMRAQLTVLSSVMYGLKELPEALIERIYSLMLEVTRISYPAIISAGSEVVYRLFSIQCHYQLDTTPRLYGEDSNGVSQPMGIPASFNGAVAKWVPRDCRDSPKLTWFTPSKDSVSAAIETMEKLVNHLHDELVSMKELDQLTDAHIAPRMRLRRLQMLLGAIAYTVNSVHHHYAAPHQPLVPEDRCIDLCWVPPSPVLEQSSLLDDVLRMSLQILKSGVDGGNMHSITVALGELERVCGSRASHTALSAASSTVKFRDRSLNEPVLSDWLLGLEPGSLGAGARQPYWASRRIVMQAYFRRISLRAICPMYDKQHPHIQPSSLSALGRQAIATLVQMCFHRCDLTAMNEVSRLTEAVSHTQEDHCRNCCACFARIT